MNNTFKKLKTANSWFMIAAMIGYIAVPILTLTPSVANAVVVPSNPPLGQSCGLDIALVVDSSGSINNTELGQMKTAFNSFVSVFLPETPTQFSVTEFDNTATIRQAFTTNESLINTAINSAVSGGATNWQDGLLKAKSTFDPRPSVPNLVIFASDGEPNKYYSNVSNPLNPTGLTGPGNGFNQAALNAAITQADIIKNAGTRIITLGIGVSGSNADHLKAISSADAYYNTADFGTLAITLQQLATELCGGHLTVTKRIGTPDSSTPAAAGWTFDITPGHNGQTTDGNGQTAAVDLTNGTYNVTEVGMVSGYSFGSASCTGATNNGTTSQNGVSGIQITTNNIVSCVFYNSPLPECTIDDDCDDGLYCNGVETCDAGGTCQAGTSPDCSGNSFPEVTTCLWTPDGNTFTYDFRSAFTSICNEDMDLCVSADNTISHTCNVDTCGAQCDSQHLCADTICGVSGCQGNDYYTYNDVSNTCQEDCTCTNNSCEAPEISINDPACTECDSDEDCNSLDRDYCDGTVIKHDEGTCVNYECQASPITGPDCDNSLACDGQETCSDASCVAGTSVDCSQYNITEVNMCGYDPDCNPYTLDYRISFVSECQDPEGTCTMGDETISHTCDAQCDAECVSDVDCDDQNPNTTDICNLTICECEHTTGPTGTVEGHKYNDLNKNGAWDEGEIGLGGWNIWIDLNDNGVFDGNDWQTTSDGTNGGLYAFLARSSVGTYNVCEIMEDHTGWDDRKFSLPTGYGC